MHTRRSFLKSLALLGAAGALAGCRGQSPTPADPAAVGASGKPVVYASFYPIHSLVSAIAGDALEVRAFMPPGQDPHLWEPSPKAMQGLARADLLVVNGANMEPWLPQVRANLPDLEILVLSDYVELITYKGAAAIGEFQYLAAAPLTPGADYRLAFGHTHERNMRAAFFTAPAGASEGDLVARGKEVMEDQGTEVRQKESVELVDGEVLKIDMGHESGNIDFRVPDGEADWYFVADRVSQDILSYDIIDGSGAKVPTDPVIDGSSSGTDEITFDPHSWMSVINAKRYCNAIHGTLGELWPEQEGAFGKGKFALVRELTRLQGEYKEIFGAADRQEFIVSHNGFAYLARDFGLQQRSLQGLTTNEAPSLYSLVAAIRYVRAEGIRIVYHELGVEDPGIETIVGEVGGETLPLASMEHVSADDGPFDEGYLGYLRMNLENLAASIH